MIICTLHVKKQTSITVVDTVVVRAGTQYVVITARSSLGILDARTLKYPNN